MLVVEGEVQGLIAIHMSEGELVTIKAKSVVLATGGAGRVYHCNTNGGIVTGDGMAMAYRHGVPLRDMEFVQYHPTGLPGTGILMTEGCRGEGGIIVNKNGYRYLQDYGMGPETPVGEPKEQIHGARVLETKYPRHSGMSSKKAILSSTRWVMSCT